MEFQVASSRGSKLTNSAVSQHRAALLQASVHDRWRTPVSNSQAANSRHRRDRFVPENQLPAGQLNDEQEALQRPNSDCLLAAFRAGEEALGEKISAFFASPVKLPLRYSCVPNMNTQSSTLTESKESARFTGIRQRPVSSSDASQTTHSLRYPKVLTASSYSPRLQ
jgi:hypothetical protein